MSKPAKISRMLNHQPNSNNSAMSQALNAVNNDRGGYGSRSRAGYLGARQQRVQQPPSGDHEMEVEVPSQSARNMRTFTLGYKRLEELANSAENNHVVVFLANSRNGFENFIKNDLNIDKLTLVFKVLKKVSMSDFRENIATVLVQACNQKFLDQILNKISFAEVRDPSRVPDLVTDMLVFFETTISLLPNLSCDRLSHIVVGCQGILEKSVRVTLPSGTLEKFESIHKHITHLMEKKTDAELAKESKKDLLKFRPPPNDFREMSLYPTLEDIVEISRPFLRPNLVEGRYTNVEHYLDVQFRLMHEDVFRPLREGIAQYRRGEQKSKGDSSIKTYENVRFLNTELKDGIQEGTRLLFDPLKKMANVDWELSKRFIHGALLCFTKDDFKSIICATILNRDVKDLKKGILSVEFCDIYEENIYKTPYLMVESEVFYEPYLQVMRTLQSLEESSFPMQKYIVEVQTHDDVPPYLLVNTHYEVPGIAGDFSVPVLNTALWPSAEQLGLDPSQHKALQAALTREMVVIQGPPGTGKTYMGLKIAEILIKNKYITSPKKPLLVVCLTNHALDQFLMGITKCTKNLIRIGGQSRCEEMAQFNLKFHRTTAPRTQTSKQLRSNINQEKAVVTSAMEKLRTNLSSLKSVGILTLRSLRKHGVLPDQIDYQLKNDATYLQWLTPRMSYKHEVKIGDLEFTSTIAEIQENMENLMQQEKNENVRNMKLQKLQGDMEFLLQELQNEGEVDARLIHQWSQRNVLHLDMARKWQLYRSWVANLKEQWQQELRALETQYSRFRKRLDEMQMVEDLEIMRGNDVIGMTTNGAARLHSLLSKLGPQIVIVEEAAEVLEAHIVACLSRHCQHLILIGDHKQLRPNTAVYALSRHFKFDVSLFERMVKNRGLYETLIVQHRMSPVLATLIVPRVYEHLENHPSVLDFPEINGIPKRLFFLTHSQAEKQDSELSSRTNDFEAKFVLALCRHLVLQGYSTSQITALATYKGQMFLMKKLQREISVLQGMQVTVVDNFQGEENNIIVLSLVRSNKDNAIGYLATENRMCVALSRARHALYVVGNMQCLAQASDVWKSVEATLTSHEAIGQAITLRCQVHPDQFSEVSCAKDFDVKSPEGGCTEMCTSMLACGHMCNTVCHSLNRNHENMRCYYTCDRICANLLHKCSKKCYEKCGECKTKVLKELRCGHQALLPCYLDPEKFTCRVEVEKTFIDCKHKAIVECNVDPAGQDQCPKKCNNRLNCGHKCGLKCHVTVDPEHITYVCRRPCGRYNLNCSTETHECGKLCYETCNPCSVIVEKKRQTCGHKFRLQCSEDAEIVFCKENCKRSMPCGHFCKEKCGDPCKCHVRVTKVIESCKHNVRVECDVVATRKHCMKPCELKLSCGHPCSNLCCQPCSSKCEAEVGTARGGCGHQVPLLCWENQAGVKIINDLDRCREPCGVELECKHTCPGTCGSCVQGRIHQLCNEPCGKPLVCGHSCTQRCNAACVPCNKTCEYRCQHSRCDKKCGEPCAKCIEPCEWQCLHMKCLKKCWEPCTTCKEPCKLKLTCGHPCVGLCGELCPPMCRICNFEELTELFLGYEDEEDARFVYLEECGHTIECQGLDTWLGQEGGEINVKACPRCKTPITKVPHCCSAVKQAYADFAVVKIKNFGRVEEIENTRQQLQREAKALLRQCDASSPPKLRRCIEELVAALAPTLEKRRNTYNSKTINIKEIHLNIISNISAIWLKSHSFTASNTDTLNALCSYLLDAVEAKKLHLGMQQVADFKLELQRLQRIFQGFEIKQRLSHLSISYVAVELGAYETYVLSTLTGRYNAVQDQQAQHLYSVLSNKVNQKVPGLGISQLELMEMKSAIPSIAATRWYKCNCGFIYAVGNCGGLNESGKCPDCKRGIGSAGASTSTATNFPS